ncbi:MAG TPA: LysR substrate-binding domain-containing protein [Pseudonocardiaceae bacterium]|jgi:DNA-binding transcriptional LysR family regulator|nr:LysR substrate-binding domain-containing protein [Pseudonocardiaceae bacterium]
MDDVRANEVTFGDLEMFLAFARTEHFGQTATELEVSVATVQRSIRALERKLGVQLVEQDGRRVRLRHQGNILVREAHTVLRARADAVSTTLAESGHAQRLLRIAHTYSLGLDFVPAVLAELRGNQPELRFHARQNPATDVVSAVLRGDADVGFTSLSPTEPGMTVYPLFTESVLLAVPADDPLAEEGAVELAKVRDRTFIAMEPGSSSRNNMINACARAGFVPHIAVEGSDLFVVESMVGAGIGVSLVPEGMNGHHHPRVARLRITEPALASRTIFLIHQAASAAQDSVRALVRIATDQAAQRPTSLRRTQQSRP